LNRARLAKFAIYAIVALSLVEVGRGLLPALYGKFFGSTEETRKPDAPQSMPISQPGQNPQGAKLSGTTFRSEPHGNDLLIKVSGIRIESTGRMVSDANTTRFYALGIEVWLRETNKRRHLGSTWNNQISGTLTSLQPVIALGDQEFVIPQAGTACVQKACDTRLLLAIPTSGPTGRSGAYAETPDFAVLGPSAGK